MSLATCFASALPVAEVSAKTAISKDRLGIIKGFVRDNSGKPISNAVVAVFTIGRSQLLKQVTSDADGSFFARISPGTYTVLAVAEGFNPQTVREVQIDRATELNYGFNLERSGSGNTLPEKKADRTGPKSVIRAAQSRRSIYQNQEGNSGKIADEIVAETPEKETVAEISETPDENRINRAAQSVVETYTAATDEEVFQGFNFATFQPLNEKTEIILVGQTGTSNFAPQRFETTVRFRPNENHRLSLKGSAIRVGKLENINKDLGQFSVQALDEWQVREGVIVVLGLDYSRFVGASNEAAISPRFGLQFDADSKTRFRAALTTATEEQSWRRAVELEDTSVAFRDQITAPVIAVTDGKATINRSRRMEFGVERVLDDKSTLEATAFLDTIAGRGVGLVNLPFEALDGGDVFVANQQGKTQGFRAVYSRRLNNIFSASAGYAIGRGQKVSAAGLTNPAKVFVDGFFRSFVGQLNADLRTGTRVKTVFRLSPDATVFAIDPFQGRLAIYDPSLSIFVSQTLPTLGLPIRAEAVIDARNILDYQTTVNGEEGTLKLNSQKRILRGGISVRF